MIDPNVPIKEKVIGKQRPSNLKETKQLKFIFRLGIFLETGPDTLQYNTPITFGFEQYWETRKYV